MLVEKILSQILQRSEKTTQNIVHEISKRHNLRNCNQNKHIPQHVSTYDSQESLLLCF